MKIVPKAISLALNCRIMARGLLFFSLSLSLSLSLSDGQHYLKQEPTNLV